MLNGLANVGNTCSINTLIQCIGHCPLFLDFVLKNDIEVTKIDKRNYAVYLELKDILIRLWVKKNSVLPNRFIDAFYESIGNGYMVGEQLDFTEMWMLLLNNLVEETHSNSNIPDYRKISDNSMQQKVQDSLNIFFKNTNSPLINLLYGSQVQQITCNKCNHISHSVEPISFTYIDNIDIIAGLQDIMETQKIKDWKCENCSYDEGGKFIRFWKLPKIWMIVLQRYDSQNIKTSAPINIAPVLNIDKEVESGGDEDARYELVSIANHYGSLEGGHYTAVCKNNGDLWCEYNDLKIGIIPNIDTVLTQNRVAYALIYERV